MVRRSPEGDFRIHHGAIQRVKSIVLLVIHGSGSGSVRAENEGQFVLINIPSTSACGGEDGQELLMAIGVEEYGGDRTTSAIFWGWNVKKIRALTSMADGAAMDQARRFRNNVKAAIRSCQNEDARPAPNPAFLYGTAGRKIAQPHLPSWLSSGLSRN